MASKQQERIAMVSYTNGPATVTVKRISGEFRCRLHVNGRPVPAADYFTDHKQDAHDTAEAMATRAAANEAQK